MELLDLPTELLERILQETMPEGFESFAVTCKAVYRAGNFIRPKHNAFRKRYRRFAYGDSADGDACISSLQLIARIAQEPIIAKYIVSANLVEDISLDDAEVSEAHIQEVTHSTRVLALLETSPYLQSAGVDPAAVHQYLVSTYRSGHPGPGLAAALLLTLLPNVSELALPKRWVADAEDEPPTSAPQNPLAISSLVDLIVSRANDPSEPTAGLSRLTTILPSTAWGYDNRWALALFQPFLSIRTVRTFVAGSCVAVDDQYTGNPFPDPKHDSFGQSLEAVELVGACADDIELRKVLSRMPRLRSFCFSFETKWHGCCHDWDAGAVMRAIEAEVGRTLERLSFSILNCYGDSGTGVYSLKGFTRLKEVELGVSVLLGPQHGGGSHGERNDGKALDKGPREVPRLGDLLPPTIEKFCLVADRLDDYNQALNWLFSNIVAEKDEKLPNLKEIILRNGDEGDPEEIQQSPREEDIDTNDDDDTAPGEEMQEEAGEGPGDDTESDGPETIAGDSPAEDGPETTVGAGLDEDEPCQPEDPRTWDADLEALGSAVEVKFVKVVGERPYGSNGVPLFMKNFCTKYSVEWM